ncbi:MAG: class I SAM-dependent methyltransferase [Saprospiraceae bacterium]|nr:class I SAM-dependent methyltransferase [Saprospiraceae bacterium]MBL0190257.1 class I SAM-dependent methyltransferase [Saprospiraceae bacterium]
MRNTILRDWVLKSRIALKYFHFNEHLRDCWVQAQALKVPNGSKVLDVGAGSCPYRNYFSHCQYKTHDFAELKEEQLRFYKGYGNLDFVSDISSIPVEDNTFDYVLCTEVLEHVPEPILAIKEFARILKPGGKAIITAPLLAGIHQEPYNFYAGYTPFWYQKFLSKYNFENIEINENGLSNKFYSQESLRFLLTNHPFANFVTFLFTPFWIILCAILVPFAFVADIFDRYDNEKRTTVGYFVTAQKKV